MNRSIFYHTQKKTQHLKFVKLMVAVYDHIQRVPARERYTETRIFMSPMIQGLEIEEMFCAHQNKLDLIVNDDKFMKKNLLDWQFTRDANISPSCRSLKKKKGVK